MATNLERVIRGEKASSVPFWFMRQAGRYLAEYKQVRASLPSFLSLCYTPDLAAEVTLQPIRRFDMSAAIIFSDILVVPHAMGVKVEFLEGEGPKLSPVRDAQAIASLKEDVLAHLAPVAEALRKTRAGLSPEKSLIGFCGAPWTVACYMIEGKNKKGGWEEARRFALAEPVLFATLIDKLVRASCDYLLMQVAAGANVVQIFDSWAGVLSESEYHRWVIEPTRQLVGMLHAKRAELCVIGFPRGSGILYVPYAKQTGVDAVGLDFQTPLAWAADAIDKPLQGNLDPLLLANDKEKAVLETKRILNLMRGKPFIFNLGHGIVPYTPVENVAAVCDTIRAHA